MKKICHLSMCISKSAFQVTFGALCWGARGLGPRKALFDRWLLGFKILQENEEEDEEDEAHINF